VIICRATAWTSWKGPWRFTEMILATTSGGVERKGMGVKIPALEMRESIRPKEDTAVWTICSAE
jgi:hypothetical protein